MVFDPLALRTVCYGSQISQVAKEEVFKDWSLQVLMHVLVKQAILHVGRVYLCIVGANLWNSSFLQQHDLDEEDA